MAVEKPFRDGQVEWSEKPGEKVVSALNERKTVLTRE